MSKDARQNAKVNISNRKNNTIMETRDPNSFDPYSGITTSPKTQSKSNIGVNNPNPEQTVDPKTGLPISTQTPGPFGNVKPANDNPATVEPQADKTNPKKINELLEKLYEVKPANNVTSDTSSQVSDGVESGLYEENESELDPEELARLEEQAILLERERQLQLLATANDNQEAQVNDTNTEAEARQNARRLKPQFPFILFGFFVIEYGFVLILSLMGLFFSFTVTPIGLAIGLVVTSWKIVTTSILLTWAYFKERKAIAAYKKIFARSTKLNNVISKSAIKYWNLEKLSHTVPSIIPLVGALYPGNILLIYKTHNKLKNIYKTTQQ